MASLEIDGVSKDYGSDVWAERDQTLTVRDDGLVSGVSVTYGPDGGPPS